LKRERLTENRRFAVPKADLIIFIEKGKVDGRRKNGTRAVFA
jgi:hypothetical protein